MSVSAGPGFSRQRAVGGSFHNDVVHGELQILEHFLGFLEVVIRSADDGKFDRKGGDHRESVPFSCRLVDATSDNKQQLEARSGKSQRSDGKAFKLRAASSGIIRQLAVTRPKPRC